jgi:Tfp pilus assembly protein PilN
MIQFNLLPSVKLDYVQAQRTKRTVMVMSVLVAAIAVAVLVVLFLGVQVAQKKHSSDLSKDIQTESKNLQNIKDLDKILTIQNQLGSLTALHDQKPVATRLFEYVKQLTPANVSIAQLEIDFDTKTLSFTGSANAISSVNKFADTLKFTTFKKDNTSTPAFSEVVLAEFGKDDKGTSYGITVKFNEEVFSSAHDIKLDVPAGKITTRSETEKPENLFQPLSTPEDQ